MTMTRNSCIVESNLTKEEYKKFLAKNGLTETFLISEMSEKEASHDKQVVLVDEKDLDDVRTLKNVLYDNCQTGGREFILLVWDFDKFKNYNHNVYRKIQPSLFMVKKVTETIYLGAESSGILSGVRTDEIQRRKS